VRLMDGAITLSASDLTRFIGCRHATALDLARLRGEGPEPRADSEEARLLQKSGLSHEYRYLDKVKSQERNVLTLRTSDVTSASDATREAMHRGIDVIYQGAFLGRGWGGWADFVERVEKPSNLGAFSYEVVDTKLKNSVDPKHVLQLVLYSDLVADIQGTMPEFAHIELGNGKREVLRLSEYVQYARNARALLEAYVDDPHPTRPVPCSDCVLCRWTEHCSRSWQENDSLFNIANITHGQVKKLEAAGIRTMEQLAVHSGMIRGLATPTLERLKAQARLQHARKSGEPRFELRPQREGKGFALLPEPKPGDLFYDIEGDPHYPEGLEYLHGVWFDGTFQAFWAHDHDAEMAALTSLLAFFKEHLARYPNARIYHYAAYEMTALRRLTKRYGVGEPFLDRLQREKRFVDLYAVVGSGLICSEPNYSIKSLEVFYGLQRTGEVKTAGGSVVAYERWRETSEQAILHEIEKYNRLDCVSTERLRDWLIAIRPEMPWPVLDLDASEKEKEDHAETIALRKKLAQAELPVERRDLLFNLGMFHKREAKPAWWAIFDSLGKDDDQLVDDLNTLAGLKATGASYAVARSKERIYSYPHQETKLKSGDTASVSTPIGFASVTVTAFDPVARQVKVRVGQARADLLRDQLTLHPNAPLNTEVIAHAVSDVIDDQCSGESRYVAVDHLLSRKAPRLTHELGALTANKDAVDATVAVVHAMQQTVLPIQGPPGTGKTYVTARAILSLVRAGHRVGVTSNSHEAIRNVLRACLQALEEQPLPMTLDLVHKVSSGDGDASSNSGIRATTDNAAAAAGRHVVGGTAFFFARDENIQAFDWLFVDEAGQVGLANMVGIGRAARNIVLVGDPRQLPQVIQGAHPKPANLSCLEWMLGEHATIPPDRGIFLPVTRRLHPAVNRFISQQFYEGRLSPHPDTAFQAVKGTAWPEAGAFWVSVSHEGNAQVAPEEVQAIRSCCQTLVQGQWCGNDGETRPLSEKDIIVVAPYNAQVSALRAVLPSDIRVGTVDKFQGQEAPVCIVSMTASSTEESPRGIEFLFSMNRVNVAVSRAKALALVFGATNLRHAKCTSVEQLRMTNSLCSLDSIDPFPEATMTIDEMLQHDLAFDRHFCSLTTINNLRGIPLHVLREVVRRLHNIINFSALASPRLWTPVGSEKTIVVAGTLSTDGRTSGHRFGICADTSPGENGEAQALYIWVTASLMAADRMMSGVQVGRNFSEDWVPWRCKAERKDPKRYLRYCHPVASRSTDGWRVTLGEAQGDLLHFLSTLRGLFDTPQKTRSRLRPTLDFLGHDGRFISPQAIDVHRHPDPTAVDTDDIDDGKAASVSRILSSRLQSNEVLSPPVKTAPRRPTSAARFRAADIFVCSDVAPPAEVLPFMNLSFQETRQPTDESLKGTGLYGIFFTGGQGATPHLIYVGLFRNGRKGSGTAFGGNVLRDRWIKHIATCSMRGYNVGIGKRTARVAAAILGEHPLAALGHPDAEQAIVRDRGCNAGENRVLFAKIHWPLLKGEGNTVIARFTFSYVRIQAPLDGESDDDVREVVAKSENKLKRLFAPICNGETAVHQHRSDVDIDEFERTAEALLSLS
jgi:predicted RecB family nuclease